MNDNSSIRSKILAVMIVLMPLVFNPLGFDMYGVPKNLILKIGVSVLMIFFAFTLLKKKKITMALNKHTLKIVLVFLLILALAEATALRQDVSFWGSYFRQGGILNMLNYAVLFTLCLSIFANKKSRNIVVNTVIVSGWVSAVYAILQGMGVDFFTPEHTAIFEKRSFAGMGNPTALGAFLLFPIGAQLLKLHESKRPLRNTKGLVGLVLMLIALGLTRNRASILGLLAAVGIFVFRKVWSKPKWRLPSVVGCLLALTLFVQLYGADTRSLESRLTTWHSGVDIIREAPLSGNGPESFDILFERFVRADFFLHEDYRNLVDRPHNEILETWIHFGLAGLIFYGGLWVVLVKRNTLLSLTLIALLVSNLFGFSLPTHYALFAVFLALITAESGRKKTLTFSPVLQKALIAFLIVAAGFNAFWAGRMAVGDFYLANAFFAASANNIEQVDRSAQRALALNPMYADTSKNTYDLYFSLATTFADGAWLQKAAESNAMLQKVTQTNLHSLLNEARIWSVIQDYAKAEEVYMKIAETKGVHPVLYEEWANMYVGAAQYDKAAAVYDELFAILPPDWKAPILTEEELTREQRIFWKEHEPFIETLDKALKAYAATGQTEKAQEIVEALN